MTPAGPDGEGGRRSGGEGDPGGGRRLDRDRPTVLVPLRVLEGESIPEGVPDLLAGAHVVLAGYHVVPEQTAPGQARMQFEERANRRLAEYADLLEAAGVTVERQLVFTHEGQKTIDRLVYEHDCAAVLVPNATGAVENVLVAVRGAIGLDRIAHVAGGLFGDRDVDLTLYHVAAGGETDADAEVLLEGLAERLEALGVDPARVETRVERDREAADAIAAVAEGFDAVVMGESDSSLATFVFGMPADQVAERFLGPVLVVQRPRPEKDGEGG